MTRDNVTVDDVNDREEGYRIDDLARLAGTTVRNIRAYQDRGLIPPPRREGRVGLYSEAHLARLRLISHMLGRGYSLGNIGELLEAWEGGQELGDLLGLEAALTEPWAQHTPIMVSLEELAELFGVTDDLEAAANVLSIALEEGLIRAEGEGYVADNPGLLRVGAELVAAGVPASAVLERRRALGAELDVVAAGFVDLVSTHVFAPLGEPIPASEVPRLADLVRRLRPLAGEAVAIELAEAMDRQVQARLSEFMTRILEHSVPPGHTAGDDRQT
jgi:DNA-binding transcriptional MerR regulator